MKVIITVATALVASVNGAKIFYSPACNTNVDNPANLAQGSSPLSTTGPRSPSQIPQSVDFSGSSPIDANFPSGQYALGELDMPDGFAFTLVDGATLDFVESASGAPAVIIAGQASKPECDITCHANYRDGMPANASNDLSMLPVAGTAIQVNDTLIFPEGYNYVLEAHGGLVAVEELWWKGTMVSPGSWMPPCTEVTPCNTDAIPLLATIGPAAQVAFLSLYGSSADPRFTSCPVSTGSPPTLSQDELVQIDMRRVGVQTSSAARLIQMTNGVLSAMCQLSPAISCPTTFNQSETLIIDVTGYRPRSDLAVMSLPAQMAALEAHIAAYLAQNVGEINGLTIVDATYAQATGNQLRLEISFNVTDGDDGSLYESLLISLLQDLVGSFTTTSLGPCVSLTTDVDYLCVTQALQAVFQTAYDGTNTMSQVEEALRAAYAPARGCTIDELVGGDCSAAFTATLSPAETTYRENLITSIIAGSTTPSPTGPPLPAGQTAAPVLAPTSLAPVTHMPTTEPPATAAPTTPAPITYAPTSASQIGAPTTLAPTSLAPTTPAPITHAPTTLAPVTFAPTTLSPTPAVAASAAEASDDSTLGGIPLLYVIIIIAVIVVVIAVAVFIVSGKKQEEEDAVAPTVAFENPMYDSSAAQTINPVAGIEENDMYDEPAYAANNVDNCGDDEEDDDGDNAGGYLDVEEAPEEENIEALYDDGAADEGSDDDEEDE